MDPDFIKKERSPGNVDKTRNGSYDEGVVKGFYIEEVVNIESGFCGTL